MIYLPLAYHAPEAVIDRKPRQGVCLLYGQSCLPDVELTGSTWYYDYGATAVMLRDPRYVPMSWGGSALLPNLPPEYAGYLLVLNEPDNAGQLNISPAEAAKRVRQIAARYPQAKIIAGGITYFGQVYLAQFVAALGSYRPAGWHIHGYCEWGLTPSVIAAWFRQARDLCHGGEFWVTEFADVDGGHNAAELIHLVRGAAWIDRYAWFANRISGAEWFIPAHWHNPALVGSDGTLTALGDVYHAS